MEQNQTSSTVTNDVLHFENHSKLTPEEIAKAIAHHKKGHHDEQPNAQAAQGKKQPGQKAK